MSVRIRLISALLLVLLAGCASAPPTRYYALSASAGRAERPANVAVVIRDVRLPSYLDRRQIVSRDGEHGLHYADTAEWAGELRQDLSRVLAENLGRLLGSDRVFGAPLSMRLQPDFRVELEVLRFERQAGGPVELSARWWLTRGADDALLSGTVSTLRGDALAASVGYEALVAQMSSVYARLAQEIARSILSQRAGGA